MQPSVRNQAEPEWTSKQALEQALEQAPERVPGQVPRRAAERALTIDSVVVYIASYLKTQDKAAFLACNRAMWELSTVHIISWKSSVRTLAYYPPLYPFLLRIAGEALSTKDQATLWRRAGELIHTSQPPLTSKTLDGHTNRTTCITTPDFNTSTRIFAFTSLFPLRDC